MSISLAVPRRHPPPAFRSSPDSWLALLRALRPARRCCYTYSESVSVILRTATGQDEGWVVDSGGKVLVERFIWKAMTTVDEIREIWMPPVLLDELRAKLRSVGTEVGVLGFWSRLQGVAYGLALCRADLERYGVVLPYGIEVLATAAASGSPLVISGAPEDLQFCLMGGGQVACRELDFEIEELTRTFRVQLNLEMFATQSPSGLSPSKQIQRLFVDGASNLIAAVALPLNDNTAVSLADSDAKTCSDLHVVKKKADPADDWLPTAQSQGPQAQRSKKKGNKKRPRKPSAVAAREDEQDEPAMNEVDPAPDGFPVELVPLCAPSLGPTEKVSTPLFEADADGRTVWPAHVDALLVLDKDAALSSVAYAITTALTVQSRAFEGALTQMPTPGSGTCTAALVALHFKPPNFGPTVTLVKRSDEDETTHASVEVRRALHEALFLPTDRPIFRRACAYEPVLGDGGEPRMTAEDGRIICPHRGLPDPGTSATAKLYLVEGRYSYYHYMQDKFNDNGWGCAYRSLQTIVSWCRFQMYTEVKVPTHREVQTLLVEIGDKPPTFIGSKEWIGANEVCYVLDTLCSISSKIMFVGSGAELESKGRELARHFSTEGTPIMVGGGVLAYTILGVMFDDVTGATRFLILDPHYTGGEDLGTIQGKGWVGWKGGDLFRKDAFYNLCMPVRPKVL